eukprot:TRINITY_DN8422_c0_g1_i2.p1 TRINITY_DN8422_c0_g1~~TRINITY_DN8422_c0_g1_i2.p1  ORF type:complete len:329 (+),score=127.05 TRINITY_DN8422_c0_g1_i2:69-1055(+)
MPRTLAIVITQHGSHGDSDDMEAVKVELQDRLVGDGKKVSRVSPLVKDAGAPEQADVVMWETDTCKWFGTERGTMRCASTIAAEFDAFATPLVSAADTVHLVLVGHSMGGLICRALLRKSTVLRDAGHIQPLLFLSIATPHVGAYQAHTLLRSVFSLWGRLVSQTCQDILHDSDCLEVLCDDDHLDHLKRFKQRCTVTNVERDHMCSFHTCSLTVGDVPSDAHPDERYAERIRKHVPLLPDGVPSEGAIRKAFSAAPEDKLRRIVRQMHALRQMEWTMVGADYSDSMLWAHTDIIGMGTVGDASRKGRIAARHLADLIHDALREAQQA